MIIQKVELKISTKELTECFMVLEFDLPQIPYTGEQIKSMKSYYSLLIEIRTKLAKKVISHQNKTKPFKLSLHFFEATCLHETMKVLDRNRYAQSFFEKLDQKLA